MSAEITDEAGLRVVIAAAAFAAPAGTESYMLTVARELQRLGHSPVIWADELGPMADHAERNGVPVARAEVPECDVVLANDAISAATLAERLPRARVVQVVHSDLHDHQLPVLLDGALDAVVVPSARMEARVRALPLRVPVVRLTQPIDPQRFTPQGPIRPRPRRAILLSNYLSGPRLRALVEAWEPQGVECIHVGAPADASLDVVPAMAGADIVVGKGRAALEGMSCARAVYVYDAYAGDGWVTPESYPAFEADNFGGFATPAPKTAADLAADLAGYHPDMGWLNRELVVSHHAARLHAVALVDVLRGPGPRPDRPVGVLGEVARLTRLNWQSERRAMLAQGEVAELRARTLDAEVDAESWRRQAEAWQQRALAAEAEVEDARRLLGTRRAQAGLRLGRGVDRMRRRA